MNLSLRLNEASLSIQFMEILVVSFSKLWVHLIRIGVVVIAIPLLALSACSDGGDDAGPPPSSEMSAAAPTNRVDVPASVRTNLGITFAKVERRRVSQTIRVPGHFELLSHARQEYRAPLEGRVELLVQQYESVDIGSPLYRLQSPQWAMLKHDLFEDLYSIQSAKSEATVAEAALHELESAIALRRSRIASLEESGFSRADLELEMAELQTHMPRLRAVFDAKREATEAAQAMFAQTITQAATILGVDADQLLEVASVESPLLSRWQTLDWIEVRAVQGGLIDFVGVSPGGWIDSTSLVLTTMNPTLLRFRAVGLQADLPRMRPGSRAFIVPPQIGTEAGSQQSIAADFVIGPEADPQSRTVSILAMPHALTDWARAGVSGFLEIETEGTAAEELVIPRSTVVQDGLSYIIFRRDPANPDKVIRMDADLGLSDGRWIVINSGVRLGDEVVLDGVYELKLATSGQTVKGGHFHADGTFHADH